MRQLTSSAGVLKPVHRLDSPNSIALFRGLRGNYFRDERLYIYIGPGRRTKIGGEHRINLALSHMDVKWPRKFFAPFSQNPPLEFESLFRLEGLAPQGQLEGNWLSDTLRLKPHKPMAFMSEASRAPLFRRRLVAGLPRSRRRTGTLPPGQGDDLRHERSSHGLQSISANLRVESVILAALISLTENCCSPPPLQINNPQMHSVC